MIKVALQINDEGDGYSGSVLNTQLIVKKKTKVRSLP